MGRHLHRSCTRCPAALLCRLVPVRYSSQCPGCGRKWLFLTPASVREAHAVVFPHGRPRHCDDRNLAWSEKRWCPVCREDTHWRPGPRFWDMKINVLNVEE